MRKKLFANWGIKLISLLAAFSLWFVVVFIDDPPEVETFVNIPVRLENTQELTAAGYVYEVLDGTDIAKKVTVKGPKTVLSDMLRSGGSDCIIATADFKERDEDGVIRISFGVTSQYESAITEIVPGEGSELLKLFVEKEESKSIAIKTLIQGEVGGEHQLGSYGTEQTRLTITGGESKVDRVSYAAVTVDVTGNESNISTIETIRLYDKDGKLLDDNLVQRNVLTTKVNVNVLDTKTVPIEFSVVGEPQDGYLMTGQVESSVSEVKVAGTEAALAGINVITIPESVFDVDGATGDYVKRINLRSYLPSGVQIARDEENTSMEVKVYIEPVVEVDYKVSADNIAIYNVPLGLDAEIEQEYSIYDLVATGLAADLEKIEEQKIAGSIDVAKWMETQELSELSAGVYYIPVNLVLPENVEQNVIEVRVTFYSETDAEE